MPAQVRELLERPFILGTAGPDDLHCYHPKGSLAHTSHSSHRAASRRVYCATLVLTYHRPCRMIAESGTPARARAIRPPWL